LLSGAVRKALAVAADFGVGEAVRPGVASLAQPPDSEAVLRLAEGAVAYNSTSILALNAGRITAIACPAAVAGRAGHAADGGGDAGPGAGAGTLLERRRRRALPAHADAGIASRGGAAGVLAVQHRHAGAALAEGAAIPRAELLFRHANPRVPRRVRATAVAVGTADRRRRRRVAAKLIAGAAGRRLASRPQAADLPRGTAEGVVLLATDQVRRTAGLLAAAELAIGAAEEAVGINLADLRRRTADAIEAGAAAIGAAAVLANALPILAAALGGITTDRCVPAATDSIHGAAAIGGTALTGAATALAGTAAAEVGIGTAGVIDAGLACAATCLA
jgi:hypothetical protein